MNAPSIRAALHPRTDSDLERRLRRAVDGEVLFDAFIARPLRDRCIDLPDRADRCRRPAHRPTARAHALEIARSKACRSCRAEPAPRNAARPSVRPRHR